MDISLITMFQESIRNNQDRKALADYKGESFTYAQVARQIARIHIIYERHGVKPGDKIALCGRNCARWAMTFLSSITYGAVTVPLLHEFKPESIQTLVNHSEASILFVDKLIWHHLDITRMPNLRSVICIDDYSVAYTTDSTISGDLGILDRLYDQRYPSGLTRDDITYHRESPDSLALINYTSGSTGTPKGVMLTYRNLWSNIRFAIDNMPCMDPGDGMVSMLPMAHMYGLVVEFLFPFIKGASITYLGRVPSPSVLLGAFASVRPRLIVTVPLVIDKLIRTKVFPELRKPLMRTLLAIPGIRGTVYRKLRHKLLEVFGGNLFEVIVGGAALSKDVESFLRTIKFPFTVGYGMTECAPLIAYAQWDRTAPGACGRIVDRMQCRIDSADPQHTPGVLYVKGDNVMQGYYKNPEATAETLSDDGWLRTGDMCTIDPTGLISIHGRDKNMILGASGQNIYPEEIEAVLNNLPYVAESIVVERAGQLVAIVYPDMDKASNDGIDNDSLGEIMSANLTRLNHELPAYSRVKAIELRDEPFEKTPKQSIRRFLYK